MEKCAGRDEGIARRGGGEDERKMGREEGEGGCLYSCGEGCT